MPRRRNIVPDDAQPGAGTKLVLLRPEVTDLELSSAPDALRACAREEGAEALAYTLRLEYADFTADQVLRRLLPAGVEVPTAFETIGHIIHVNLREEQLPHKALIAQVLLDKHGPRIRSVVNKLDSISNQFRVFPMELIAGDPDMRAEVRQNGCVFQLRCARRWRSRGWVDWRVCALVPRDRAAGCTAAHALRCADGRRCARGGARSAQPESGGLRTRSLAAARRLNCVPRRRSSLRARARAGTTPCTGTRGSRPSTRASSPSSDPSTSSST